MRASSSVVAEERFHQELGIDRAALRLEDEADILGRFIAHIGEERQLLLGQEFGDLFDRAGPSAPDREFR